jgi:RimJ/RimL family protein N-acetyltransferase
MNIKGYKVDIDAMTYKYYSHWAGIEIEPQKKGIFFNHDSERDNIPKGYSNPFNVYIFAADDLTVISYGDKAKIKIENIVDKIKENKNIETLRLLLKETFLADVSTSIKYIYKNKIEGPLNTTILNNNHADLYLDFFKENHPKDNDYSWVEGYFFDISSKNYCHGIITDNKLVSVTDAPDMPFMQESVQEVGINTLKEYRGKGYAKAACISLINELISRNICPLWSTDENNTASDHLAKSIGFKKLADVLSIHIPA